MPPLPGPRPETSELRVLTRTEVTDGVVLAVTVEILQTSRPTDELPPPCPVAERAARGVGSRSRSRSRTPSTNLSEAETEYGTEVPSPSSSVLMPSGFGGEAALVPRRRATVVRRSCPVIPQWKDALEYARRSLVLEGITPRGKVKKLAQEIMMKWRSEEKLRWQLARSDVERCLQETAHLMVTNEP